jgi:hypothetical protein
MKQISFITILIITFGFTVLAQTEFKENDSTQTTTRLIWKFNDTDNEWHKLAIDIIKLEFSKNSSLLGLIIVRNDKNVRRRLKLLEKAITFQKADSGRIRFLVIAGQKEDTNVLICQKCVEIPEGQNCIANEHCIVIKAVNTDKIDKLFRPKINRNRKNK